MHKPTYYPIYLSIFFRFLAKHAVANSTDVMDIGIFSDLIMHNGAIIYPAFIFQTKLKTSIGR